MSTRLKLSDSVVINADELVLIENQTNAVNIITTIVDYFDGDTQNYFQVQCGTGNGPALKAAIEAALVSAPSGRVIEVPASKDYTIGALTFNTDF